MAADALAKESHIDRATARRPKLTTIIKLVVTVGLSAFLLSKAGIDEVGQALGEAHKGWVALGIALAALAMVINVTRWQLMLRAQRADASLLSLIRLYLIGMFFNNFLPGRMGGDVVRAYGVPATTTTRTRSVAAVLMDRLVGAISVLVLAAVAIALGSSKLPSQIQQATIAFFPLSLALLALMIYRNDDLAEFRLRVLAAIDVSILGFKIRPRVEAALNALRSYSRSRGLVLRGFALSLVANGVSVLNLYLYARSVQADVSVGDVANISPFILAIGLLPISINGLGTIEATYVFMFGLLGVDSHVALATAILRRLALLLLSLIGGALYVLKRFL